MPPAGATVLIDTNAIGAAHRHRCWNALRKRYRLCTVEVCLEEATRTDRAGRRLVERPMEELRAELDCVPVSVEQELALVLALEGRPSLDPGEKALLAAAHALGRTATWVLCGPDKATLRAMHRLKLAERMVSLEELAAGAGAQLKGFEAQYGTKWLQTKRARLALGDELI